MADSFFFANRMTVSCLTMTPLHTVYFSLWGCHIWEQWNSGFEKLASGYMQVSVFSSGLRCHFYRIFELQHPFLSLASVLKITFLDSLFCIQTWAISTLQATFLIAGAELVQSHSGLCSWARNQQIALPNLWNAAICYPLPSPYTFNTWGGSFVDWIHFRFAPMRSTVAAWEIEMWKEHSTFSGLVLCNFLYLHKMHAEKGGRICLSECLLS